MVSVSWLCQWRRVEDRESFGLSPFATVSGTNSFIGRVTIEDLFPDTAELFPHPF